MKKSIQLFAAITLIALSAARCGGDAANGSPREVLIAFAERMSKKDIDGAAKYATAESQVMLNMMKNLVNNPRYKEQMSKQDMTEQFNEAEIGEAEINGDVAHVPIKSKKEGFDMKMPMKKENGAWKVDLTINSMMNSEMTKDGKALLDGEHGKLSADNLNQALRMKDSLMKTLSPEQLEQLQKQVEKYGGQMKEQVKEMYEKARSDSN